MTPPTDVVANMSRSSAHHRVPVQQPRIHFDNLSHQVAQVSHRVDARIQRKSAGESRIPPPLPSGPNLPRFGIQVEVNLHPKSKYLTNGAGSHQLACLLQVLPVSHVLADRDYRGTRRACAQRFHPLLRCGC